jgi:glycyl-tRNA synthetase beta chain
VNIVAENKERVIHGNERVLRARLSDATFFFETDKKVTLMSRIETLKHVIFQHKLGTLFDKTERLQRLATKLAKKMIPAVKSNHGDEDALVARAALLAKTDLTTELVSEFPELQGIAGYYYALHDGESEVVAIALKEHYLPRMQGDVLPETHVGCVLALADRIDTLTGLFGMNYLPSGDKDPFGLRRAALGLLRLLIEKHYHLNLHDIIAFATGCFASLNNKNVVDDTVRFILDRLKPFYQEQGIATRVIASVMSLDLSDPYDIHQRIQAVVAFQQCPEAEHLSIANKRVNHILSKYDDVLVLESIDMRLLDSNAEQELASQLIEQEVQVSQLLREARYHDILVHLAKLRTPIDNFFDQVMVLTEDKTRRENRLCMLKKLRTLFLYVADIALLQ